MVTRYIFNKIKTNKDMRQYKQLVKVLHHNGIEPGFAEDDSSLFLTLDTPLSIKDAEVFNQEAMARVKGLADEPNKED